MTVLWHPTFHNSLVHSSTAYTTDSSLENGQGSQSHLTDAMLTSEKLEGMGGGLCPSRTEAIS